MISPANLRRAAEMERRYSGGETLEEIGRSFGLTRERVRQIMKRRGVVGLVKQRAAATASERQKSREERRAKLDRWIYFIRPVGMSGPIKIGCSELPENRLLNLSTWSPFPLEIVAKIPGNMILERAIHVCFADAWSHREWFRATPELLGAIEKIVAGVTLADAIDLNRSGVHPTARSKKRTPEQRLRARIQMRLRYALLRAERATGERRVWPEGFERFYAVGWNSPESLARFESAIADPVAYSITLKQRWPHWDSAPKAVAA